MKKTILACALMAMSFASQAAPRVIGEMSSNPGEDRTAFVTRVAKFMHQWTDENKVEACGMLGEQSGAYSIVIGTSDLQIACDSAFIHGGYTATGVTIHSHPKPRQDGYLKLDAATRAILKRDSVTVQRKQFSDGDYKAGPGYLVTENTLLYQEGVGTRQVVTSLGF